MRRRKALLWLAALGLGPAAPHASAQPGTRDGPARVAILDDANEATRERLWAALRGGLRQLGYVEGRNVVFAARFAGGDAGRLAALAAETVASRPDVIVTVTTTAAIAARKATSTIPIVALGPADPVKSGLVVSLARPGGNLTGLSPNQGEIAGKWLELLRALVPGARTLVYLTDTGNPGEMLVYRDLEQKARAMGITSRVADGTTAPNVDRAFASMHPVRPDGLVVATTAALLTQKRAIVDGAKRLRLPAIYARQEYPEAGGLVSYGADSLALFARAADYVDRILRGTSPSELPFEMASTFRMVLNPAAARDIGLAVPKEIRIRADEVIE